MEDFNKTFKDAWKHCIREYGDVFEPFQDNLELVRIRTTPGFVKDRKGNNTGLALTRKTIDSFEVEFSELLLDLDPKDIIDVVLHEMAHCAIGIEFGDLFYEENGGHNKDWRKYMSKLNRLGCNVQINANAYLDKLDSAWDELD